MYISPSIISFILGIVATILFLIVIGLILNKNKK